MIECAGSVDIDQSAVFKSSLFGKSLVFFQWFISFDTPAEISHHFHVASPFTTFLHHLDMLVKTLTLFITIITKIIRTLFEVTKLEVYLDTYVTNKFLVGPEKLSHQLFIVISFSAAKEIVYNINKCNPCILLCFILLHPSIHHQSSFVFEDRQKYQLLVFPL